MGGGLLLRLLLEGNGDRAVVLLLLPGHLAHHGEGGAGGALVPHGAREGYPQRLALPAAQQQLRVAPELRPPPSSPHPGRQMGRMWSFGAERSDGRIFTALSPLMAVLCPYFGRTRTARSALLSAVCLDNLDVPSYQGLVMVEGCKSARPLPEPGGLWTSHPIRGLLWLSVASPLGLYRSPEGCGRPILSGACYG